MGLKKNIFYSGFLTTGMYLSQLITFPYITKTLGVTNFGYCNFVQSFVQFFLLFSALGISTLGVREIAKVDKNNQEELNHTFSVLITLAGITTLISFAIYLLIIFFSPQLQAYYHLLLIGGLNIIFSLFNIEWLYRGLEDFKYITYRVLLIRILYILLIFIFVTNESHYVRYYFLSVMMVPVNSIINWLHAKKIIKYHFPKISDLYKYVKSNILIGIQIVLLSYNSTINPVILGLMSNDTEVGYFTTATKLIIIVLLFYNAYTSVLLPRISSMLQNKQNNEVEIFIKKSFALLYFLAIPLLLFVEKYTPEIIHIIANADYSGSILPMRICMPVILIGGISQIIIQQVLIPNNLEKDTVKASILGVLSCIILSYLFIPKYQSIASSVAWLVAEFIILIVTFHSAFNKIKHFNIELLLLFKYIIIYSPIAFFLFSIKLGFPFILELILNAFIVLIYIHIMFSYIVKDSIYQSLISRFIR